MSNITISRRYTHHPEAVIAVQAKVAEAFNELYGCSLREVGRQGGLCWERYAHVGNGVILASTLDDKHDNTLTVKVNERQQPNLVKYLQTHGLSGKLFDIQ